MASRDEKIRSVEASCIKSGIADFKPGDTVNVHVKIMEEGKARIQSFEGVVISRKGSGMRSSFTVRKVSFGEGVERVFPLNSPTIDKIVVVKHGEVRRAKLYYLRKRTGKATKIDEKLEIEAGPGDAVPRKEGQKEGV